MSSDYTLGQSFSDLVRRISPNSQQKLIALLIDHIGSDDELISAFRLLFSNPIYVSSFLSQAPLGNAELSSLNTISQKSLSFTLSTRVDEFVRGYFESIGSKNVRSYASPTESPSQKVPDESKSVMPASSPFSCQTPEEVTLFASDDGHNFKPNDQRSQSPGFAQPKQAIVPKPIHIKSILILLTLAFSGFAAFKIQAICEPFGLCSVEDSDDTNQKKQVEKDSNLNRTQNPAPSAGGGSSPNRESSLKHSDPPRSQQGQPSVKQTPPSAPQPNDAPLRDEPLW
jgi:hypothetical protein